MTRRTWYIIGVVACLLALTGFIVGKVIWDGQQLAPAMADPAETEPAANPEETPAPPADPAEDTPPEEELPDLGPTEAEIALTVDLGEDRLVENYNNHPWTLLTYSMSDYDNYRIDSNAVSIPFAGETDEDMYYELQDEILRNVIFLDMTITGLKDRVVDNKTLGELNPWMEEGHEFINAAFQVDPNDANSGHRGNEAFIEFRPGEGNTIYVRYYIRTLAAGVCTILDRMEQKGIVENLMSTDNYILGPQVIDFARRTQLNTAQEDKPTFLLQWEDTKTGVVSFRIGFNRLDKRLEIFDKKVELPTPAKPAPAKPAPSQGAPTTPTPTSDPVATPTPETVPTTPTPVSVPTPSGGGPTTPTPSTPPTPPPSKPDGEGGKDPSQDPGPQGNAPIGGGRNDDPGPGPYEPASTVQRPTGDTIVTQPSSTPTQTPTPGTPADPTFDDGHKVDAVVGSPTPPPVTTPITQDPGVGGSFGDTSKGDTPIENGDGKGNGAVNGGEHVTEAIDDPF